MPGAGLLLYPVQILHSVTVSRNLCLDSDVVMSCCACITLTPGTSRDYRNFPDVHYNLQTEYCECHNWGSGYHTHLLGTCVFLKFGRGGYMST